MFGLESEGRGAFELSSQVGHIKLIDIYVMLNLLSIQAKPNRGICMGK